MHPSTSPPQSDELPPISRTSSLTSFSSIEDDATMSSSTVTVLNTSRRTRKRFTNIQLTMLENLFHQNSHPSREDREAVAKAGAMEIKSVTIWFQNKRQTERKTAASNNANHGSSNATSNAIPNITSTIHTFSLHNDSQNTSRTASPPFSVSSRSTTSATSATGTHSTNTNTNTTTSSSRPSLDRVASRSELRASAGAPRTPSRRQNPSGAIWDNMPSSPLASPISPPSREYIDFSKNAKTRRTLEWACAAARLADKDGYASGVMMSTSSFSGGGGSGSGYHSHTSTTTSAYGHGHGHASRSDGSSSKSRGRVGMVHREKSRSRSSHLNPGHGHGRDYGSSSNGNSTDGDMDMDVTDDEDEEAITPPSTWGKDDRRWMPAGDGAHTTSSAVASDLSMRSSMTDGASRGELPKGVEDDDMFKAALALCGLGRRT